MAANKNAGQVVPGHIPTRLSTDEPVTDYTARNYVMTGPAIYSDEIPEGLDEEPLLPEHMLPRRASAEPSDMPMVMPSPGPAELPDTSEAFSSDLVRRALHLLNTPDDKKLTAADRIVLQCASALLQSLLEQVQVRLDQTSSTSKTKPASTKNGTRRTK